MSASVILAEIKMAEKFLKQQSEESLDSSEYWISEAGIEWAGGSRSPTDVFGLNLALYLC